MTMEQLRVIVAQILTLALAHHQSANNLVQLLEQVTHMIDANNPLSQAINVDQFVAIYAPIYTAHLTAIETTADALGTDPFH